MLLQDKGLIRIIQGKGTLVLDPRSWNMIDNVVLSAVVRHDDTLGILEELIVVRAALEREMAAAAADRATPAQLELLDEAFGAMRRAAADVDEFAQADVRFHNTVIELSGNRLARAIVSSIHDKARATLRYRGSTSADMIAQTLDEHRAILEAICHRDAGAANQAMYAHITGSWARRRPAAQADLGLRELLIHCRDALAHCPGASSWLISSSASHRHRRRRTSRSRRWLRATAPPRSGSRPGRRPGCGSARRATRRSPPGCPRARPAPPGGDRRPPPAVRAGPDRWQRPRRGDDRLAASEQARAPLGERRQLAPGTGFGCDALPPAGRVGVLLHLGQQRPQDRSLGAEGGVHGLRRYPGALRDGCDRGPAEPVFGEQFQGRRSDPAAVSAARSFRSGER